MAAAKTGVLITQLADQLRTRFQRQNLCFQGPSIQWDVVHCRATTPEVGIPTWRPPKRKYLYLSLQTT